MKTQNEPSKKSYSWLIVGISWGILMSVFMTFVVYDDMELTSGNILKVFLIWMVTGLLFGYIWKITKYHSKKKNKNLSENE